MANKRKLKKKRRKGILVIFIFIITIYLLFISFVTLFKRNAKTTLPERMLLIDTISSQGFLIKNESIIKATNSGDVDLIANEGERLGSGREVLSINTLKDIKSLEYELEGVEKNISSLKKKETESDLISNEKDKIELTREELILELQDKISSSEFNDINFIKEQLLLYDGKYKDVDFSKTVLGQSVEGLEDRKKDISKKIDKNNVRYYTDRPGVISYKIDGYEEVYLPKDFENYTYDKLNVDNISKTSKKEEVKVSLNQPIFKIIDNFKWYIAIKIKDSEEISDFNINDNIRIYINESQEEVKGRIIAINNSKKKAVIILELNTMFHKYYNLRFPKIEIIKEKTEGYKLPKKSIASLDNIDGVYIKDRGGIVRFKPVSIFKEEDDYVYIHIGDEKSNIYLKDSKEAVKTINLFDEIIINPNNIKEGDILY